MSTEWSAHELDQFHDVQELQITTRRDDGKFRRWVPVWVVCVDQQVYVRTWHRRDTGWFGHAVRTHQARVRLPNLECDVLVDDLGAEADTAQFTINSAYTRKYGTPGDATVSGMVTPAAVATTLELIRAD